MLSRWYISRRALLAVSRRGPDGHYQVENLERLARHLRVDLPHMPREWKGYRSSLVRRLERVVSEPRDFYPGERDRW